MSNKNKKEENIDKVDEFYAHRKVGSNISVDDGFDAYGNEIKDDD